MSGTAGLDLRYPIGGLFTVLGLLLAGYGVATRDDARLYARATGLNINLWWGLAMLAFGALCLALAARAARAGRRPTMRAAAESPEGRETERRERELGLER